MKVQHRSEGTATATATAAAATAATAATATAAAATATVRRRLQRHCTGMNSTEQNKGLPWGKAQDRRQSNPESNK